METITEREKIALKMFCATLNRTIEKADRKAFPEGVSKVFKEEIQAAYEAADFWIEQRKNNQPTP